MNSFAGKYKRSAALWLLLGAVLIFALPITAGAQDTGEVFVSVRHYEGVDPANHEAIDHEVAEGFLPIMRASEGFVGYYALMDETTLTAISLFETAEQASASNEAAREFVAEKLANLLPENPQIFEGPAGLHYVSALEGMEDGIQPRYASVRIYRDVDMAHIDDANELAETILLPTLKAIDGFFAQHTMHAPDGATVAISITETRAAAEAANASGKTFTAEHLSDWLPGPPTSFDATVRVAALAGLGMGENLASGTMAEAARVFASIRHYDGLNPADHAALTEAISSGFLDIMRESAGFVGYFALLNDSSLTAVSLFETSEAAAASNEAAREFVVENLASMLPEEPSITEGELDIFFVDALHGAQKDMMADGISSLFAAMRVFSEINLDGIEELYELSEALFTPQLQANDGFFSQFALDDGDSTVVAITLYDSPEAAMASSDLAVAFVAEHGTRWLSVDPLRVDANVAVAALAEINMGGNLIGEMMSEG